MGYEFGIGRKVTAIAAVAAIALFAFSGAAAAKSHKKKKKLGPVVTATANAIAANNAGIGTVDRYVPLEDTSSRRGFAVTPPRPRWQRQCRPAV